jgi:hypothetical protein
MTLYHYGYRTDEFMALNRLNQMSKIRPTLCTIKSIKTKKEKYSLDYRPPVSATLPVYLNGYVGLKPDDSDIASIIDGIKHRVGGVTPTTCEATVREFAEFNRRLLIKLFPQLDADTNIDVQDYINSLQFPDSRKEQLRQAVKNVEDKSKKMNPLDVKSFIKEESYFEPKAFRTINSRIDEYKVRVGPWIHAVEKLVFKMKWFIKTIPVCDRAAVVIERLEKVGRVYMSTDFTAYESSFRKHIMEAAEFQLFEHVTKKMPGAQDFMSLYKQISLDNRLLFDAVVANIACKRMSGEMSTSIANGYTNLALVLFTAYKEGMNIDDLDFFVEGDDAIISCVNKLPTTWFERLGFLCKMEVHNTVRTASFCGLIFSQPGHIIRDPRPVIAKIGWAMRQYVKSSDSTKKALLRAKALSLACEMPNCPILSPLAHRLMELTAGVRVDKILMKANQQSFDMYHKVMLINAITSKPWQVPPNILADTRVLMEIKYGIHVEIQIAWEKYFSTLEMGPMDLPAAECYLEKDWHLNWDNYVTSRNDPWNSGVKRNLSRLDAYSTFLPDTNAFDYRGSAPSELPPQMENT